MPVRSERGDPNATSRWLVETQPQYLNFFASQRKAQEVHDALARDPDMDVNHLMSQRDYPSNKMNPDYATELMDGLIQSIKRTAGYTGLSQTEQEIFSRQWRELAQRHCRQSVLARATCRVASLPAPARMP